jgi:hypothetical protein
MRRKTFSKRTLWRSLALLASLFCLLTLNASPALALSVNEYFSYTYDIQLSKTEVQGNEQFYATITGQATCKKDLPLAVSEARVIGRVTARHQSTGAEVVLNSQYTLTITTFPRKQGETASDTVVVPLSFPTTSKSGTYSLTGQLIEAKVKFVIWWDVTSQLPSTQPMQSVKFTSTSTDGGGGTGGGSGGSSEEEENGQPDYIDSNGHFTREVSLESPDQKVRLSIAQGTAGLTAQGDPISELDITELDEPPPPPEYHHAIGLAYEFSPHGATFSPPITVTFAYDDSLVPAGADEQKLFLAFWDSDSAEWVRLVSTVDKENNLITASISHFTPFYIFVPTRPANIKITDLTATPQEVYPGETVTITVTLTNTGDIEGTCEVSPKISNVVIETKNVTLAGGATETATFSVSKDTIGTFTVIADTLYARFTVKSPLPATFIINDLTINPIQADIGQEVTVSVHVNNTGEMADTFELRLKVNDEVVKTKLVTLKGSDGAIVPFTISREQPGTYTVSIGDRVGQFTVKKPSSPPEPRPATFNVSNLSISPTEVAVGKKVNISVLVTNIGELSGSYQVALRINNTVVATENVTLDAAATRQVTFTISQGTAGTYNVSVNNLQGTLIVNPPVSALEISHWWLTGTILAAVALIAITVWIIIRRRRA